MSESKMIILSFAVIGLIAVLTGKGLTMNLGDDTLKIS